TGAQRPSIIKPPEVPMKKLLAAVAPTLAALAWRNRSRLLQTVRNRRAGDDAQPGPDRDPATTTSS
ncbi:MAG: hypothetical protein AAGK32_16875, partial [Actinomycetota bacterium]